MAAAKLALGRVQGGSFKDDQMQKQARLASQKANTTAEAVVDLEEAVDTLETDVAALDVRVTALDVLHAGVRDVTMGNVNYALTATDMQYGILRLIGAHTGIRTLTFPATTDANAKQRVVMNQTTGGFAVTLSCNGFTANLNTGVTRNIGLFTNGPNFLT